MIEEHKLVFMAPRAVTITPIGYKYSTKTYSVILSDGDAGTLYGETFEL